MIVRYTRRAQGDLAKILNYTPTYWECEKLFQAG